MLASSPPAAPSAPLRAAADAETQDSRRMRQRCLFICRVLLAITYVLGTGLAGYILYALSVHNSDSVEFAFAIAGIFVGLAVPLALHDINMHLLHYVSPLQAQYLRILWMIPLYSLQSWVALVWHDSAMYLEAMRACYESYCLYSFYQLMLGAAGGRGRLAIRLEERAKELGVERAPCLPPCCCLRGWRMGSRFVHRNTVGIYQYVFINTIVAVLQIITEAAGVYSNGVWDFSKFYPYASILINCSQMVALYMLAYFYVQTHDWYSPVQPLYKLCVWGVALRPLIKHAAPADAKPLPYPHSPPLPHLTQPGHQGGDLPVLVAGPGPVRRRHPAPAAAPPRHERRGSGGLHSELCHLHRDGAGGRGAPLHLQPQGLLQRRPQGAHAPRAHARGHGRV